MAYVSVTLPFACFGLYGFQRERERVGGVSREESESEYVLGERRYGTSARGEEGQCWVRGGSVMRVAEEMGGGVMGGG